MAEAEMPPQAAPQMPQAVDSTAIKAAQNHSAAAGQSVTPKK
jgi:hypothetical protein